MLCLMLASQSFLIQQFILLFSFLFLPRTVCEQTTFNYKGHCYTACPERTFMLPEKPTTKLISENSTASLHERAVVQNVPQKQCGDCHSTCLRCRGPLVHDCTECATESVYREIASNQTYCDPGQREIKSQTIFNNDQNSKETQQNLSHKSFFQILFEHKSIYIIGIYIVVVIVILLIVRIFVSTFIGNYVRASGNDKKNYVYDRIAYDGTNDDIVLQREINITSSDSSDEIEIIK